MPIDPRQLAARVVAEDRAAIGLALSAVEDRRSSATPLIADLLRELAALQKRSALRIGFTGAPGVGKSSLVAALGRELRARNRRVGVLAVDPSSPRSGGALLGDRARIDASVADDGMFIRSMSTGGELGGLARAAYSAVEVLSAAHEVVLVETVGVGQSETDVELVADLTVLVLQPDSGDTLQFLKAGILEIPDLFAINKSDLGTAARQTRQELASTLQLAQANGSTRDIPRVVMTSATNGQGVAELVDVIQALGADFEARGEVRRRRRAGMIAWCQRALGRRVGEAGIEMLGGPKDVARAIERGIDQGEHGFEVVTRLGNRVVAQWRGGEGAR